MACSNEEKEAEMTMQRQLLGNWQLASAKRAGKDTDSLRGLYFEFAQGGNMKTNILSIAEEGTYSIEEGTIQQRNTQMNVDYLIETLNDTALVLLTNLRETDFRFTLKKAE